MDTSTLLENQLLATQFYVPITLGSLISRPRLTGLLNESLKYPLTLVSAPAGFGKTTLLASWSQSLPASYPRVAWVSLDEEDNEPRLFWACVLTALNRQQPECFTPLLMQLQSPQSPPLNTLLAEVVNLLVEQTDHFLLILDDYQVITEQRVHMSLAYLIEHLPDQLRIILATRADPPLPLSLLRSHKQALEVRTDQLRCTVEETRSFLQEVMGIQLPHETIQQIRSRTEGWLVGLQLLRLSLPEQADPLSLLKEVSGDQRYILDYLTEEVLQRQPQEVRTFLLSTSILGQLSASLCDAVMQQQGSQQMLQRLEQSNVFVVSLDSKRLWYRYHALFAEALRHWLERSHGDLVPILHHRASRWYAEHHQTTEAILHALHAKEWHWATDLIEQKSFSLMALTWGASQYVLIMLRQWLEQLPVDIVHSRPLLCLVCAQFLWIVAQPSTIEGWLDAAEALLKASLTGSSHEQDAQARQEQENLLGAVISWRAFLEVEGYQKDAEAPLFLSLCRQALSLFSPENLAGRSHVAGIQLVGYYSSSPNNATTAIESGLQASSLAQAMGQPAITIALMGATAAYMIGTGRLHEAHRLSQQAILLGKQPAGVMLPDIGYPTVSQAETLREWNQLDAALSLAQEGIFLCKQIESLVSLLYLLFGHGIQLRIFLSRGELDAARSAYQQIEDLARTMNQPTFTHNCSLFTTIDQIKLWLACGERDRATRWAEELDLKQRRGTPFVREREEVARVRVLLANNQPALALQGLKSVLERATAGQRWGHVIEIRLLQVLAHQMCDEETKALSALSEAVRLAEPESYIRSFVDEGTPIEALLSQLREQQHKTGPTPYLDTLLAAFQQENMAHVQAGKPTKDQPLPEPLSGRELEVLQLLAHGASNLEVAQELVIAVDTVKRHVSHIFSKLGVQNRVQAVRQARELGLLDEERQGT
jgi:LuxR family transcriptional regulator, maltose regulon positive regulatory protein